MPQWCQRSGASDVSGDTNKVEEEFGLGWPPVRVYMPEHLAGPARVTRRGLYPLGPIAMGLGPGWSGVRDNEGAEFEDIRRTRPQAKYLSLRRSMTFIRVT